MTNHPKSVYVAYSLASNNWLAHSRTSPAEALGRAMMLDQNATAQFLIVIQAEREPRLGDYEPPAGAVLWRGWNETAQNFRRAPIAA